MIRRRVWIVIKLIFLLTQKLQENKIKTKKKIIYIYIYILNLKKFLQFGKALGSTTASRPNFYYIVYDINQCVALCICMGKIIIRFKLYIYFRKSSNYTWYQLIYFFKPYITCDCLNIYVGARFGAQAQNVWSLGLMSPIQ